MHKNWSVLSWVIAASLILVLTAGIASAVPVTPNISYQGKLTDAAGNPLSGTYTLTFRFYNVSTGGTALDTIIQDVQVSQGLFTTSLAFNPDFYNGQALWLGVKAGADSEMTPRQEIQPVPYALNLVAPPVPKRYEYYTGKMNGWDSTSQLWITTDVTNMGDSAANVCVIEYGQHPQLSAWKEFKNHCYSLNPQWSKTDTPTVVTNASYSRFVKITSDSPYVAPQARFFDSFISSNQPSYEYLPGDFRKVEIYE